MREIERAGATTVAVGATTCAPVDEHACATSAGIYVLRVITAAEELYYIGQTSRTMAQRWREHLADLRANKHANDALQAAYNDGAVILGRPILRVRAGAPKALLDRLEQKVLDAYRRRGVRVANMREPDSKPDVREPDGKPDRKPNEK